jgi:outer membrane protein insertion porin family
MTTPLFASPLLSFAASAFSLDRDNSAFASHRERSQGARAKISVCPAVFEVYADEQAICPWGEHDLTYEYVNRDINHLTPNASVS